MARVLNAHVAAPDAFALLPQKHASRSAAIRTATDACYQGEQVHYLVVTPLPRSSDGSDQQRARVTAIRVPNGKAFVVVTDEAQIVTLYGRRCFSRTNLANCSRHIQALFQGATRVVSGEPPG